MNSSAVITVIMILLSVPVIGGIIYCLVRYRDPVEKEMARDSMRVLKQSPALSVFLEITIGLMGLFMLIMIIVFIAGGYMGQSDIPYAAACILLCLFMIFVALAGGRIIRKRKVFYNDDRLVVGRAAKRAIELRWNDFSRIQYKKVGRIEVVKAYNRAGKCMIKADSRFVGYYDFTAAAGKNSQAEVVVNKIKY